VALGSMLSFNLSRWGSQLLCWDRELYASRQLAQDEGGVWCLCAMCGGVERRQHGRRVQGNAGEAAESPMGGSKPS